MLQLNNLVQKFTYKTVLDGVTLNFEEGKIYSLLGENGAGKSTLAGIIAGDILPSSGEILINQKRVNYKTPKEAIKLGIMCVHQRPLLCEQVTIKENLLLGQKKLDTKAANSLLNYFLPQRSLNTIAGDLTLSEQFFLSFIGIILKEPLFLILDEPSALLNKSQANRLFDYLHKKMEGGLTVLLITHFIEEALNESDNIVLLKKGKVELEKSADKCSQSEILKLLYDDTSKQDITQLEEYKAFITNKNVTLIQSENPRALIEKENELLVRNKKDNLKYGIIPSDRTFTASDPSLTVLQITTAHEKFADKKSLEAACNKILEKAEVNIKSWEKAVNLSGGMLQRIILERELSINPDVLILCQPFQGLDFMACRRLITRLNDFLQGQRKIIVLEAKK